jgi:hypothetical protein
LNAGFGFSHPLLVFLPCGSFLQIVGGFCFVPKGLPSSLSHSLSYHLVAHRVGETMYALLKTDAEVLSKVPEGKEPPPPILYDPERHRRHREGYYEPLKVSARRAVLTLLPNPSVGLHTSEQHSQ